MPKDRYDDEAQMQANKEWREKRERKKNQKVSFAQKMKQFLRGKNR